MQQWILRFGTHMRTQEYEIPSICRGFGEFIESPLVPSVLRNASAAVLLHRYEGVWPIDGGWLLSASIIKCGCGNCNRCSSKRIRHGFTGTFNCVVIGKSWRRLPLQNRLQCCSGKKQMRGLNRKYRLYYQYFMLVGAEGFEPPTLCSQSRCATRLRYAPTIQLDCIANRPQ